MGVELPVLTAEHFNLVADHGEVVSRLRFVTGWNGESGQGLRSFFLGWGAMILLTPN